MSAFCAQEAAKGEDTTNLFGVYGDICQQLADEKIVTALLTIGASIVIASMNPVACIVLQKLARISRWKTLPQETYQGMLWTLVTQYINITIVIFLVNYNIEALSLPE